MGNTVIKVSKPFVLGKCRCGCEGELIHVRGGHGLLIRFIKGHHRKNKLSGRYKGGRYLGKKGWFVFKPGYFSSYKGGHVLENQYVFQEFHKCCMLPWGVVYHIDGKPRERNANRIENLQGMTNSQAMRLIWAKRKKN